MDDHESALDLIEMMHRRTKIMYQLFIVSRNVFDPDGNTAILERHINDLEKLIQSAKNILSGMNGRPVAGPAATFTYIKL